MKTKELLQDKEVARDEVREQERSIHVYFGDDCAVCTDFKASQRQLVDDRHYRWDEASEVARDNFNETK